MDIDLEGMTEAELVELNRRIVARLRLLSRAHAHQRMLQFRIGDRVSFESQGRGLVLGTLTSTRSPSR
jgi:hypothetical protein